VQARAGDVSRPTGERVASASILLVDDDRDQRESLAEVLEQEGYRVSQATNGEAALAALRGGVAPAVIVLDMIMPVMNGWQFCEAQRADPALARIPVVVMTAAADLTRSKIEAAQILSKPLTTKRLLAAIAQHALRR